VAVACPRLQDEAAGRWRLNASEEEMAAAPRLRVASPNKLVRGRGQCSRRAEATPREALRPSEDVDDISAEVVSLPPRRSHAEVEKVAVETTLPCARAAAVVLLILT
jgi:hypothetical protein